MSEYSLTRIVQNFQLDSQKEKEKGKPTLEKEKKKSDNPTTYKLSLNCIPLDLIGDAVIPKIRGRSEAPNFNW